jgi:conjugal transfer pilus assembly protein TraW
MELAQRGSSIPREKTSSKPIIKDYGTHGQVFNIAEECLLEEIMSRLELAKEDGTLDLLQNEFTEKVKARVLRPVTRSKLNKSDY